MFQPHRNGMKVLVYIPLIHIRCMPIHLIVRKMSIKFVLRFALCVFSGQAS